MSSTIAQTLSFHRESVTSALIEGRIPRLQDLQDEVLAAIVGQPGEHRARREIDRLPERLLVEWRTALRDNSGGSPLDEATLIATRAIAPGDEILISYIDDNERESVDKRRASLRDYGFTCDCPKCEQEAAWRRRLRPRPAPS